MGAAAGGIAWASLSAQADDAPTPAMKKEGATVRCLFLYPPSETFANDPDGWWSWPGNDFNAEGRQKEYMAAFGKMEKRLGAKIAVDPRPVASREGAQRVAKELQATPPDGLLLVMFYNRSLGTAELLSQAAEELGLPIVFFIGLGVKHGAVGQYRRPGVYFIQALDKEGP